MTQDIAVVIDPLQTQAALDALIRNVSESDFLFDETSIRGAVGHGTMFQLLDTVESLRLDTYPRQLIPGELDRSVSLETFEGEFLPVAC